MKPSSGFTSSYRDTDRKEYPQGRPLTNTRADLAHCKFTSVEYNAFMQDDVHPCTLAKPYLKHKRVVLLVMANSQVTGTLQEHIQARSMTQSLRHRDLNPRKSRSRA